jgi:hypothetical protein
LQGPSPNKLVVVVVVVVVVVNMGLPETTIENGFF